MSGQAMQMNQVGSSGVGGADGLPQHQQMQDVVGLAGLDPHFVMLRNSMREKIFEYIGRKQSTADWRRRLPELVRRLEEILFRKFSNKNDYYNMMKGPIEPQLQLAIKTLSAQNQQNQQMSGQAMQMNQVGSSGVGGADGLPQHQQMQDVVGLAGLDPHFVMLRNSMREQIFEYIGRKQSAAVWRRRLPELARRLEEILFRKFSNKNDYYNMMKGPIEPQLQFAIKILSAQNQQNQQMSRQIASSSGYGTMIPTPGITQGTSGNSRMPYVTDNTGLSSSGAGMVPQNASMGTSLPGAVRLSVPFACTTTKIATDQPQTTSLSAGKQKTPVNTSFSAKIIPTSQHVRRNIFSDHTSTKQITDTENTESQPDKAALSPTRALTNLPYKRSASPPAQFTSDPPTKKARSSTKKTKE